ncbi:uncharacterized protein LOC111347064 [Stylophora pistillata]|uniref:uncharacterized protein LOC111347064 n=1 Tax=Stylophora pistillata TaxID=50429 RepID=UPI000C040FF1|nr:uncharacterized protein LOC111347064 [Stylophora pistillata]
MQHITYNYLHDPKCKAVWLFAMDFSKAFDSVNHELFLDNHPALFKYADDSTRIVPVWSNGHCCTDLVDRFITWSKDNSMMCNLSKCKELIFRKKGFSQNIAPVNNIPQCTELSILGVMFQESCKYGEHVRVKLMEANKCLFILRSLWKDGFSQSEVDRLSSTIVLPNFTYGVFIYVAVDSDLTVIQNFLERCFKRKIYQRK